MNDYVAGLRFRSDSREVERSEKDLKGLERQSGRTEKAAERLGRTLGRVFAGVSVGVVARQIIRNTIEQEQATAKLNGVLRATGRYSDQTSEALHRHASALQAVTQYGDEAIITAQSQLLTFKELGSVIFPRATEAALDLSTVMDQDLKSSSIQLGKALNDPVLGMAALSRVGVQFTQEQRDLAKELVRTGRILEAQEIILNEVEGQMGGTARAARDTLGGALSGLRNAVGDLLEGDTSGGGLRGAKDAINDLTEALNDPQVQQGFNNLASGIGRVLEASARGVSGFANFSTFLGEELAAAVNGPALDDFERRGLEILDLERQLVQAREKSTTIFGIERPVFALRAKSLEEEIRLKKESLRLDMATFGADTGGTPSQPDFSGLDGDPLAPIVVNAEKREKELAAIKRRIARDLQQLAREAGEGLQGILDDQAATLGGPLVQAAQRYNETLAMLADQERAFADAGTLSAERQRELNLARERAVQVLNQETEAIYEEERALAALLTPAQQFIEDLQFEVEIIGLGNREREKEIALRYAGADATEAQRQRILELIGTLQSQSELTANLDGVRAAFSSAFGDAVRDIKNVGDELDRLGDRILDIVLRNLGDQLVESLLGAFGSNSLGGGDSDGGFFGGLIGALFGGGRAAGGYVQKGRAYEVTEHSPEILQSGGRQFLIPKESGRVQPITNNTTNSRRVVNNITITQPVRRNTVSQLSDELGRKTGLAMGRNR